MKIEEIEKLLEGITPGEWTVDDDDILINGVPICKFYGVEDFPCCPEEDEPLLEAEIGSLKHFTAAAPQIIRDLIAQVSGARKAAFIEAAEISDKIRMNAFIEPLQKMHPTQQIVIELRRKAEGEK